MERRDSGPARRHRARSGLTFREFRMKEGRSDRFARRCGTGSRRVKVILQDGWGCDCGRVHADRNCSTRRASKGNLSASAIANLLRTHRKLLTIAGRWVLSAGSALRMTGWRRTHCGEMARYHYQVEAPPRRSCNGLSRKKGCGAARSVTRKLFPGSDVGARCKVFISLRRRRGSARLRSSFTAAARRTSH